MSKSSYAEAKFVQLVFHGNTWPLVAQNHASPITNLYLALHSADPGEGGNQSTSEIVYTSYARATVARSVAGWTVTANVASPAVAIDFAECTGGSDTATFASIGDLASGAGNIIYKGALTPSIAISTGTIPRIKTTTQFKEA